MNVYKPWNAGLGDQIACMSLLAWRGLYTGQPQYLSYMQGTTSLERLHRELYDAFAFMNVQATETPGDTDLDGFSVWAAAPWPMKRRWNHRGTDLFYCSQYDGISSAADKNPMPGDVALIYRTLLERYGLREEVLGKQRSIAECVDLLARCAFFVGSDSGMSHLSHSVGTPTFILRDGDWQVITTHRNKRYIGCRDAEDFLKYKLPTWLRYQDFIGLGRVKP